MSIRYMIEQLYNAPISSKVFTDKYINDRSNIYLVSTDIGNGKYYTVKSMWSNYTLFGFKSKFVYQHVSIINNNSIIDDQVNELLVKYGPEIRYNIGKQLQISSDEKKLSEKLNIVSGPIISRFKNKKLFQSNVLNDSTKNCHIKMTYYINDNYDIDIKFTGLNDSQCLWLFYMCKMHGVEIKYNVKLKDIKFTINRFNAPISPSQFIKNKNVVFGLISKKLQNIKFNRLSEILKFTLGKII